MIRENFIKQLEAVQYYSFDSYKHLLYQNKIKSSVSPLLLGSEYFFLNGRTLSIDIIKRFSYYPLLEHDFVKILYVIKGDISITINKNKINLSAGDFLFVNHHTSHEIFPCNNEDFVISFNVIPVMFSRPFSLLATENSLKFFLESIITGKHKSNPYIIFHTNNMIFIENILENLIWIILDSNYGTEFLTQTTFTLLILYLSAIVPQFSEHDSGHLQDLLMVAIKYIRTNYKDASLNELSEKTGYSTYYISKLIKKNTGKNFKEMLQERKLDQAIYFLENTDLTIENIMDEIGYKNSTYFYKIFSQKYGCSPSEYRNRFINLETAKA